jgi:hypothetical protein
MSEAFGTNKPIGMIIELYYSFIGGRLVRRLKIAKLVPH